MYTRNLNSPFLTYKLVITMLPDRKIKQKAFVTSVSFTILKIEKSQRRESRIISNLSLQFFWEESNCFLSWKDCKSLFPHLWKKDNNAA